MEKEKCQRLLKEIKVLIIKFDYLISGIELLSELKVTLLASQKAVNTIKQDIDAYQEGNLSEYLQENSAMQYLDEIVDIEPINELEQQLFELAGNAQESELSRFLMQILDKIEQAHAALVSKIHDFNACLEES